MAHVWVVEWLEDGMWVSTAWGGVTREDARRDRDDSRILDPVLATVRMRIRKYVRDEPKRRAKR